jgi:hypothetical protein
MMPAYARRQGVVNVGSNERLRLKLDQFKRGKDISIAAVGGSITSGQGTRLLVGGRSFTSSLLAHYLT